MERIPLTRNSTGKALVLTSVALLALGVVMVHSAVASVLEPGAWYSRVDVRHTVFAAAAAIVLLVGWRFDYHKLQAGGRPSGPARSSRLPVPTAIVLVAALVCGVLVFVPGVGRSVGGYYRWLRVGPSQYGIGFQPSELIRISLVMFLAAWLSMKDDREIKSLPKTFLPAAGLILVCAALVVTQDFGMGALIGLSAGATLLLAGAPLLYFVLLAVPAAAGFYFLVVRDPMRWGRITAMIDPWSQTNPTAYQPQQSLMAILSGGWFGKGTGLGICKLGYLPEDSTDFIFSVFCEEWGFLGAVLLLALIAVWIFSARRATVRCSDRFGRLLAGSVGFMIAIQAVLHVAVDLVAIPPKGMSLPFVSAGGTGLMLTAVACSLMVSVTAHSGDADELPLAAIGGT